MTQVNKISDFKLERYLLGELPGKEMRELQERELSDEIFAARVREMREQGKRFLAENPFAVLDDRLDETDASSSLSSVEGTRNDVNAGRNTLWLKIAAALVIALGIFSAVVLNRNVETFDSQNASMEVAMADVDNGIRIKGMQASLEVWKKTGDSAVQMVNLGNASEGDEIQLRYRVPQKCFGMLLSMDGNGTVTMHRLRRRHHHQPYQRFRGGVSFAQVSYIHRPFHSGRLARFPQGNQLRRSVRGSRPQRQRRHHAALLHLGYHRSPKDGGAHVHLPIGPHRHG